LLKFRNPGVKLMLAVQQNTPEITNNEPYSSSGWGGMTSDNVTAMAKFVSDFGLEGIVIDYECLSSNADPSYHCVITDGSVACYTDTELLATITAMRAGLPRPIKLILDGIHVGAYGIGQYITASPDGYNSGYDVCVANDPDVLACLDAIHVMTYDAGDEYDPRTAVRAYQTIFPDIPLYLGLRVGPLQYQNVKQTANQMMDFCNTSIMLGMGGMHMYSGMWDVIYIGNNDPGVDPPFGSYAPNFPDANIAGQVVASILDLGTATAPEGSGYSGAQNKLRMNNRPPAANIGIIGNLLF
jgi:hypothetical protein